ncbi:hypothetical protein RFI_09220 [Reticulomyxa filosa]|uniref:Uncharacterized protein n=1 Tax=Reticulomyxa filosa TaxID=46433 RepID=X6NPT2_RETFI|nr:hypothetical protein RFI_09220 [Reticulomyxa filosa]|eukprot:ETO27913.1 hypothetical protein RFI_09220 [Reticulomyxa filosa]
MDLIMPPHYLFDKNKSSTNEELVLPDEAVCLYNKGSQRILSVNEKGATGLTENKPEKREAFKLVALNNHMNKDKSKSIAILHVLSGKYITATRDQGELYCSKNDISRYEIFDITKAPNGGYHLRSPFQYYISFEKNTNRLQRWYCGESLLSEGEVWELALFRFFEVLCKYTNIQIYKYILMYTFVFIFASFHLFYLEKKNKKKKNNTDEGRAANEADKERKKKAEQEQRLKEGEDEFNRQRGELSFLFGSLSQQSLQLLYVLLVRLREGYPVMSSDIFDLIMHLENEDKDVKGWEIENYQRAFNQTITFCEKLFLCVSDALTVPLGKDQNSLEVAKASKKEKRGGDDKERGSEKDDDDDDDDNENENIEEQKEMCDEDMNEKEMQSKVQAHQTIIPFELIDQIFFNLFGNLLHKIPMSRWKMAQALLKHRKKKQATNEINTIESVMKNMSDHRWRYYSNTEMHYELALYRWKNDEHDQTLYHLNTALSYCSIRSQRRLKIHYYLAHLLHFHFGKYSSSEKHYRLALDCSGYQHLDSLFELAFLLHSKPLQIYSKAKRLEQAVECLTRHIHLFEEDVTNISAPQPLNPDSSHQQFIQSHPLFDAGAVVEDLFVFFFRNILTYTYFLSPN